MPSIYDLKPRFQEMLSPFLRMLHSLGISANQITVSSIVLSAFIGLSFWFAIHYSMLFWVVPIGLLFRMALNALDGMMATTFNQQSKKGEVLNEFGDVVSDLCIYFPLLIHFESSTYLIILFLCLSIVNEFAGLLSKAAYGKRAYDGPMGKSDRAFVISCLSIFLYYQFLVVEYQTYLFSVINLLLIVSTVNRLKANRKSHG